MIADLVARGALQQREGRLGYEAALPRGGPGDRSGDSCVSSSSDRQTDLNRHLEQRLLEAGCVAGAEFSTAAVAATLRGFP